MTLDAKTIIAMEYARDIEGEHEMGLLIIGEQFAKRVMAALKQGGFASTNRAHSRSSEHEPYFHEFRRASRGWRR